MLQRTAKLTLAGLLFALSTGLATPALASNGMSRQQAADEAIARNGGVGKVLNVQQKTQRDGNTVYSVKVLTNGRVRVFQIPANAGSQ